MSATPQVMERVREALQVAVRLAEHYTGHAEVFRAALADVSALAREQSAIVVWRFHDAPRVFRDLSDHGGDEDWLAVVPASMAGEYIGWLQEGSLFGICSISEHRLDDGSVVYIGAHA